MDLHNITKISRIYNMYLPCTETPHAVFGLNHTRLLSILILPYRTSFRECIMY